MEEETLRHLAMQLKKSEGETGVEVAHAMNSSNERINRWTIEQLNVSPGDNILEIGMGNGFFVKDILLVDSSVNYTGGDHSELMVNEATSLNKDFVDKQRARFFQSDIQNFAF